MEFMNLQDPRHIPKSLLEKYDVRGPRYTSYPPATHFHPVETTSLYQRWTERNQLTVDPGISLYIHIPFCRTRCLFCGCHTFVGNKDQTDPYVDALIREMNIATSIINPARTLRQVAVGGGSPNFLEAKQIDRLLQALRSIFSLAEDAELSVEIDPRSSTKEKLSAFLQHGFNRFSLGVQDFSPIVLNRVRRGQGLMQVEETVRFLREWGCTSINFDLIYGLPGQDLGTAAQTAATVIGLRPTRIALYSYAHLPALFHHQKALDEAGLPDAELKSAIFLHLMDRFIDAGYIAVGMDHFALPTDPLAIALSRGSLRRNFMGYTVGRGLDLLGIGASAISSIGSAYSQNEKDLAAYQATVTTGTLPVVRGFLLEKDDQLRRELILTLFCNFRADLNELSTQFEYNVRTSLAAEIEKLRPFVADGLVTLTNDAIHVTDIGRFFIRNICMVFDRYLERDATLRRYSRTI
jgi:oxygen-independent coproporphyrinogen-3 oxidase